MQVLVLVRAVKQLDAVEGSVGGNTINLAHELRSFSVQSSAVSCIVGGVGRLHGQFTDTLQVVANGGQAALSGLRQRDTVIRIANGSGKTTYVGGHTGADGQASSVVFSAIDANARRQALHGSSLIQA